MRIMTTESSITREKPNYKEFLKERIKVTNSVYVFCNYFLEKALKYGKFYYPSLSAIKSDNNLGLSSRTIDSLTLFLVEEGILEKLPRSKSQPFQIELNKALFRFVLTINQPSHSISINNELKNIDSNRIKALYDGKNNLKEIIYSLEFETVEFSQFLDALTDDLEEKYDFADESNDLLKESLKSIFASYSENIASNKFNILNDFLQEEVSD